VGDKSHDTHFLIVLKRTPQLCFQSNAGFSFEFTGLMDQQVHAHRIKLKRLELTVGLSS
jgi:hypothetical protein